MPLLSSCKGGGRLSDRTGLLVKKGQNQELALPSVVDSATIKLSFLNLRDMDGADLKPGDFGYGIDDIKG